MVTRLRRTRAGSAEVEKLMVEDSAAPEEYDASEEADESSGSTEKTTLDRIEQRYRDRADSPLRAIRAFCVLCMGCQPRMVADCTATACVLYQFRFGKNPFQKHTKKTRNLKSIAAEDSGDDEHTGPTDEGVKPAVRAKRQGRTRS